MKSGVRQALQENIVRDLEDHDEITLAFQGGEPTPAGLAWYEEFIVNTAEVTKKRSGCYVCVTNQRTAS
jgi:uncharacterized protein